MAYTIEGLNAAEQWVVLGTMQAWGQAQAAFHCRVHLCPDRAYRVIEQPSGRIMLAHNTHAAVRVISTHR